MLKQAKASKAKVERVGLAGLSRLADQLRSSRNDIQVLQIRAAHEKPMYVPEWRQHFRREFWPKNSACCRIGQRRKLIIPQRSEVQRDKRTRVRFGPVEPSHSRMASAAAADLCRASQRHLDLLSWNKNMYQWQQRFMLLTSRSRPKNSN